MGLLPFPRERERERERYGIVGERIKGLYTARVALEFLVRGKRYPGTLHSQGGVGILGEGKKIPHTVWAARAGGGGLTINVG